MDAPRPAQPSPRASPDAAPDEHLARCLAAVVPDGDRLLLAVSGGSDSVALAGAAARANAGRCHVIHVDHGLRPEAAADARWVSDLGDRLGLPTSIVRAVPDAGSPGRSETAARDRRHRALARAADRVGARWILLAQHRDDATETVALHLLRGHRGDRALAGIPTVRPVGEAGGAEGALRVLRPFLFGPRPPGRGALARARRRWGLDHREDATNADRSIPRVDVRAALAEGSEPLTAERLERLRQAARRRLERRLAHVVALLEQHLVPEGLGALLRPAALEPAPGDDELAHRAELVRLLGPALAPRRRLVVRPSLLARLADALQAGQGRLPWPGAPGPLEIRVSRAGLHLPATRPAGPHPGWTALGHTPLYLG